MQKVIYFPLEKRAFGQVEEPSLHWLTQFFKPAEKLGFFPMATGQKVYAPIGGRILLARDENNAFIVILTFKSEATGLEYRQFFSPLQQLRVKEGQTVRAGQLLGTAVGPLRWLYLDAKKELQSPFGWMDALRKQGYEVRYPSGGTVLAYVAAAGLGWLLYKILK